MLTWATETHILDGGTLTLEHDTLLTDRKTPLLNVSLLHRNVYNPDLTRNLSSTDNQGPTNHLSNSDINPNLDLQSMRAMVMTHIQAKGQGQRSLSSMLKWK